MGKKVLNSNQAGSQSYLDLVNGELGTETKALHFWGAVVRQCQGQFHGLWPLPISHIESGHSF